MNLKISNEIRTALLGIITLIVAVFGYNYLKGKGTFGSNRTFYALYDNSGGLTEGCFVQIQGVNIGSVLGIKLSEKNPGKVEVKFNVTDKTINIPSDSKAVVLSDGLIGAKILGIEKGASKTYAVENDFISSYTQQGMMDKLQTDAGPILKNVDGVVLKANGAITTIDNTVANINSLIDANTKANLQSSISGLNKSVQDFNILSASLAAQRQKISATVSSLEAFANNLNKNNAAINATMTNVQSATKKVSDLDLENTVNNLKKTLAQLDGTIGKINSNEGTLGMLVNDKKLYNDLQGSLHSLDALLADIKARPGRYISVSVFGKKQKYDEPTQKAP